MCLIGTLAKMEFNLGTALYLYTLNPHFSFVCLKLSSKTNESIPNIEAGCNLKV